MWLIVRVPVSFQFPHCSWDVARTVHFLYRCGNGRGECSIPCLGLSGVWLLTGMPGQKRTLAYLAITDQAIKSPTIMGLIGSLSGSMCSTEVATCPSAPSWRDGHRGVLCFPFSVLSAGSHYPEAHCHTPNPLIPVWSPLFLSKPFLAPMPKPAPPVKP